MSDTAVAGLECEECGADSSSDGTPFDQGRLNRHMSRMHPDAWEKVKEERAIDSRTAPARPGGTKGTAKKAPVAKSKKERHDLTGGIQANTAGMALLIGARNPWRGQVLTAMAPTLAEHANASAQEGPDWWYEAVAMMSTGGVHVMLVFDLVAIVIAFRAEKDERARGFIPGMRGMGIPLPPGPWENGSVVPEAKAPRGPVSVDVEQRGQPVTNRDSDTNGKAPMAETASGIPMDLLRSQIPAGMEISDEDLAKMADEAAKMMGHGPGS